MASFTKLPSGNWRALVRTAGAKPLSATFPKKSDAIAWAKGVESKRNHVKNSGAAPVPGGMTFGDFLSAYIEEVGEQEGFGRSKKASLEMIKKELGQTRMDRLNESVLWEFARKRAKSGAGGVTVAADLSYVSVVLRWIKGPMSYDIDARMALNVRSELRQIGLKTRGKERKRIARDAEIEAIIDAYRKKPRLKIDMPIIIQFALATSMRLSEITRIRIEDFDAADKTVIIRDRKDPREKEGNDQTVPLLPDALKIVQENINDRKIGRIFQYDPKSISTSFTRITRELGIDDLHFHDLRHTAITNLFKLGLSIELVSIMSGHKDWKMLKRYTHLTAADVHKELERIQARDS